jgi:hypothetical protein
MTNKTKHNLGLDVAIFVVFLVTVMTGFLLWRVIPPAPRIAFLGFPRPLWLTFHICSALASLAGVVLHVAWHWDWLKALRRRPLSGLAEKLRLNRIVDRVMWITFIAANVTGVLAWALHLGDDIDVVTIPDRLHVVVGVALAVLATVHLILHWKWIASTTRRYIQVNSHVIGDFQRLD